VNGAIIPAVAITDETIVTSILPQDLLHCSAAINARRADGRGVLPFGNPARVDVHRPSEYSLEEGVSPAGRASCCVLVGAVQPSVERAPSYAPLIPDPVARQPASFQLRNDQWDVDTDVGRRLVSGEDQR
jgi:hypothetical protein